MNRSKHIRKLVENTAPRKDLYPDVLHGLAHLQPYHHPQYANTRAPMGPHDLMRQVHQHVQHFGFPIVKLYKERDRDLGRLDSLPFGSKEDERKISIMHSKAWNHYFDKESNLLYVTKEALKKIYRTTNDYHIFEQELVKYLHHYAPENFSANIADYRKDSAHYCSDVLRFIDIFNPEDEDDYVPTPDQAYRMV